MSAASHDYRAAAIALGTMHGKDRAIRPAMQRHLAAGILPTHWLDTDRLTGEVARCGTGQDAMAPKAQIG